MLAYVLDAAARRRPARRRSSSTRRRPRRSSTSSPTEADFALQDEPRGTGDAVRAAAGRAARRRRRDPRPLGRRAARPGRRRSTAAPRGAPRRRRGDGPGRGRTPSTRPASAGSCATSPATGRADRRGEGRRRRGARSSTRSTPASTPSTRAWLRRRIGDLTPSPATGELYLTELVALAREDGRLVSAVDVEDDGRFDGHQRSLAARRGRVETCASGSTSAHMRAGVTMRRPVHGLRRLDGRAGAGRHPRAERHPARHDPRRRGERRSAPGSQLDRLRSSARDCRVWASVVESLRRSRTRSTIGPVQPTCARAPSSATAPRSATSPSSRTAASAPASSSTT